MTYYSNFNKKMKKIIKFRKNRKARILSFVQANFFDLLFSAVLIISLLGFIKTVDDGLYLWRRYYAEDVPLTLNLIEGLNEDISIRYDANHDKFFGGDVNLELDVKDGKVSVFDPVHAATKSIAYFLTKKDKSIEFSAPLRAFTITKSGQDTEFQVIDDSCNQYSVDYTNYLETTISLTNGNYNKNSRTDLIYLALGNKLINLFKQKAEDTYNGKLSSEVVLAEVLYDKNIKNIQTTPYLNIQLKISQENEKKILIYYSTRGLSRVSETLGCVVKERLAETYGEEYFIELKSLNTLQPPSSDSSIILIDIQSSESNAQDILGDLTSQSSTTEAEEFIDIIHNSILIITRELSYNDITRLKTENGLT